VALEQIVGLALVLGCQQRLGEVVGVEAASGDLARAALDEQQAQRPEQQRDQQD
jgi:hypothetical protein